MKERSKNGFTLVELLVTLVILAIVMSIGGYAIIQVVNGSKKEDYNTLVSNIKSAAETYYQECKYVNKNQTVNGILCNNTNDTYTLTLGSLVSYGYLTGNNGNLGIVNPKDNVDIKDCSINIKYNSSTSKVDVTVNSSPTSSCPTY